MSLGLAAVALLAACAGRPGDLWELKATVTGLTGTGLILQVNGGNDIRVDANGIVTLASMPSGTRYTVTVKTHPSGPAQLCEVVHGAEVAGSASAGAITVSCVSTFGIGGTVRGLLGSGLTLHSSLGEYLNVAAAPDGSDVSFVFPGRFLAGATYEVTIAKHPTAPVQACEIANGNGAVRDADVLNVSVLCTIDAYSECHDGVCTCGDAPQCDSADAPSCCADSLGAICTDLQLDPENCGTCRASCDEGAVNVVPSCRSGKCVRPAPCSPGFARCPSSSTEASCSTNTAGDSNNCGACGSVCPAVLPGAQTLGCRSGKCVIQCTGGAQDCNGNAYDGCECSPPVGGSMACSGTACSPQCSSDTRLCGTSCVPTVDNCTGCGLPCARPSGGSVRCVAGACVQNCPASQVNCGATSCVSCSIAPPYNARNVCVLGNACGWGNDAFARCGLLSADPYEQRLYANETLFSCNGRYRLDLQGDSNLVVYESASMTAVWSSGTYVAPGNGGESAFLKMQGDGNLVLDRGGAAVFSSGTWTFPGAYLVVEDNGILILREPGGQIIWTGCKGSRCRESPACVNNGYCQ